MQVQTKGGLTMMRVCCRTYCQWMGIWIAAILILLLILFAMDVPPFAIVQMLSPSYEQSSL